MQLEVKKFLYDVQQACEALEMFTTGKSLDDYEDDLLLRSGVERQLMIVGEALGQACRIDDTLHDKIAGLAEIIGFRNIVVHGYSKIHNETVWGVLQNDLPLLAEEVRVLMQG